jgi:hypothetical protein
MGTAAPMKKSDKIDSLMEQAAAALARTDYFECERASGEALTIAHRLHDYGRMERILMPLEECRRQKRLLAAEAGMKGQLSEFPDESFELEAGCWLIEPPLVGADGRELRRRANEAGIPVLLIVREPKTQLRTWPIVMIGVKTVRAYVEPPKKGQADVQWLLSAAEALGDAAIEMVDRTRSTERRINDLVDLVDTLLDHDLLHQSLAHTCVEALRGE